MGGWRWRRCPRTSAASSSIACSARSESSTQLRLGKHPAPATLDLASILQLLPAAAECGKMECTKCPSLSPDSGSQLPGGSENQGDFLRNVLLIYILMFVAAHNLRVNIEIWLSSFGPVTHFGDSLTGLSGLRPLALLIKTPGFFLSWINFFSCSDFGMLGKTG